HGHRKNILPEGESCTCGEPQAILLMPLAEPVGQDVSPEELQAFMGDISAACLAQLDHYWDWRPSNVAAYQGRLVALDFGEEEG
ncbi:MAG: hypothetical protein ACE5JL_19280, partial [Dehalococcoidia bacterium]